MEQIELKDYLRETNLVHSRLLALVLFILVLTFALSGRLWFLQMASYEKFAVLSKDNRVRLIAVPPVRGQIYDRNGRVLAQNVPVFTLEIIPANVVDMDALLDEIAKIIKISPEQISRFRTKISGRPDFEGQVLAVKLSEEEVARFSVNQHRLAGAAVHARLQRHYPYAGELVHVLGYVGRINLEEQQRIDTQRYLGTNYIGKLGIESMYEDLLLGQVGFEQVETNAHGKKVRELEITPPLTGKDLHLNIDAELQIKSRQFLDGRRGAVVALEPSSGDVLAFVSNPVYDPNLFVNGIDHASYNKLREDINRPLLNRALSGRYAPGSTIKAVVALAGLDQGWSASTQVTCPGYFQIKGSNHRYRCWQRRGHGVLGMVQSIVRSCDVYFYQLASNLGIDKLHAFMTRFGIGVKTGIDLEAEPSGLMPSREWKKRVRGRSWYPGETVNTGIGQGYMLVTPLQLGSLSATLANRGATVRPRIYSAEADVASASTQIELPVQHFDVVIDAMRGVIEHPAGTARAIGEDVAYTIAGKSGTAQVVGIAQGAKYDETKLGEFHRDHALFIAFAPVEEPKIAVAVVVENGGGGSSVAGPIARKVMDAYLLSTTASEENPTTP